MGKSWGKWLKMGKGGEKWGKVGVSWEKWWKVGKSWEKWEKVGKGDEKWGKVGISGEKRGIFFTTKWPVAAILDDRKSLSIAFLAISDQCTTFIFIFFLQNGRGHFGWLKITFNRSFRHFINTQLFFVLIIFQNGRQRPFWIPNFLKNR